MTYFSIYNNEQHARNKTLTKQPKHTVSQNISLKSMLKLQYLVSTSEEFKLLLFLFLVNNAINAKKSVFITCGTHIFVYKFGALSS